MNIEWFVCVCGWPIATIKSQIQSECHSRHKMDLCTRLNWGKIPSRELFSKWVRNVKKTTFKYRMKSGVKENVIHDFELENCTSEREKKELRKRHSY